MRHGFTKTMGRRPAPSTLTAFALLTVASLVLVSTAPAERTATTQRVVMKVRSKIGSAAGTFALTATGTGPLRSDTGTIAETVAQKQIVSGGTPVIVFTITSTWTGKRGTMVLRERIEDVGVKNGNRFGTGVWSLLSARATAQYVGFVGSGHSAYTVTPQGCCVVFRYQGSVTKR